MSATFPPELLEPLAQAIAERAAELALERLPAPASLPEYLTVEEAADYMRCRRQRVYDLLSSRRLPRHKDGRRVLLRRSEIDAYLADGGSVRGRA